MLQTKSSFRTDDPDTHLLPANSGLQPHHHPPSKAGSPARLTTSARRVPSPIPPLPGPCPLLFCAVAPGCQGQDGATPRPRPAGRSPDPPHAAPARGSPRPWWAARALSHGLPRGAGSQGPATPGGALPPASTCRDSPDTAGAAIFSPGGSRSNPKAPERTRAPPA